MTQSSTSNILYSSRRQTQKGNTMIIIITLQRGADIESEEFDCPKDASEYIEYKYERGWKEIDNKIISENKLTNG